MKTKVLVIGFVVLVIAAGLLYKQEKGMEAAKRNEHVASSAPMPQMQPTPRVPAYSPVAPAKDSLQKTLPPEQFFGQAREGYQKVREIPETIAQLPCYCHCDMHLGHKSLHTCFETEHAANCSICLNEALVAYDLKKQGKTPEQIREAIIARYGGAH
jgi:Protein of unknown function with PCYCGC motif